MPNPLSREESVAGTSGVWAARVTRVTGAEVYVVVPRHARGHEYGPCLLVGDLQPAAEQRVAVAFLEGSADDVVILGVLRDTTADG